MIWIISGTSEARELIDRINDIDQYIATIATDAGREFINSKNVVVARMNYGEMKVFVEKNNISLIIDMTHPYAKIVSENAKKLANQMNIRYIRYIRAITKEISDAIYLKSYEEAYEYLSKVEGTVFFTTGSKNISDFEKWRGRNRFIYRILPVADSIKICEDLSISMKDIVAILGPFSLALNKAMLKEYGADYLVMKDSGERGGSTEKLKACEELNIIPLVIGRKLEEGIDSLEKIENIVRTHVNQKGRVNL